MESNEDESLADTGYHDLRTLKHDAPLSSSDDVATQEIDGESEPRRHDLPHATTTSSFVSTNFEVNNSLKPHRLYSARRSLMFYLQFSDVLLDMTLSSKAHSHNTTLSRSSELKQNTGMIIYA